MKDLSCPSVDTINRFVLFFRESCRCEGRRNGVRMICHSTWFHVKSICCLIVTQYPPSPRDTRAFFPPQWFAVCLDVRNVLKKPCYIPKNNNNRAFVKAPPQNGCRPIPTWAIATVRMRRPVNLSAEANMQKWCAYGIRVSDSRCRKSLQGVVGVFACGKLRGRDVGYRYSCVEDCMSSQMAQTS